eukprot:m.210389 g.210389  ORF g.210389 m.210389 type:complete len:518 (-) comp17818_c1_seq2:8572-10125(-)
MMAGQSLTWDEQHVSNEENKYCTCGEGFDYDKIMLHCSECKNWFHERCLSIKLKSALLYMANYKFVCASCSETKTEVFSRYEGTWKTACLCILANLEHNYRLEHPGEDENAVHYFYLKADIEPFALKNWESLWGFNRIKSDRWSTGTASCLIGSANLFRCNETRTSTAGYALLNKNVQTISPLFLPVKGRKEDGHPAKRSRTAEGIILSNSATLPFNKDGFRYTLMERDCFLEDGWRIARSKGEVCLSANDRAPQLRLSEDRLTVTGERGYAMVRASNGVRYGTWYFEVTVQKPEDMPGLPAGHLRIGWSQREGNLQGPCGMDEYSYSWRDIKGTKFHVSKGKPYAEEYAPDDVLGFLIHLPMPAADKLLPYRTGKEKIILVKGVVCAEEKDEIDKTKLTPLPGSFVSCYKNGVPQGTMFQDLFDGTYYPAISSYMGAKATVNFGPNFAYPVQDCGPNVRPFCDSYHWFNAGVTLADVIEKVTSTGPVVTAAAAMDVESIATGVTQTSERPAHNGSA